MYTTLIRHVVLYRSETWALKKADKNKFLILQRKIIRKIYGPIKDDVIDEWRRRKNRQLQETYNEKNVVENIKK